MKRFLLSLILLIPIVLSPAAADRDCYECDNDPKFLIERIVKNVIITIRSNRERYENNDAEIYKLVKARIMPHIDMRQMSKLILGNNATLFTQEQFVEFSYLFENITIRSYARYILAYKDSYSLNFDDTVMNNNTAVVYMKLKIANDQVIHTEFALYRKNSKWAIINIAIEGINYGLVYRTQYNDIIKNHGVDELLMKLRERLDLKGE